MKAYYLHIHVILKVSYLYHALSEVYSGSVLLQAQLAYCKQYFVILQQHTTAFYHTVQSQLSV